MQFTPNIATALKKSNNQFGLLTEQGLKTQKVKNAESAGWLNFDTKTEREVRVEQPQTVKAPFLGPIETMLLAGLIVATLAWHHLVGGRETK